MNSKTWLIIVNLQVLAFVLTLSACSKDNYMGETPAIDKNIPENNDNDSTNYSSSYKSKYIIAHRGFHGNGIPENSKESLVKALELNIYGTEFDVRQTKDSILVICHDASFHGLTISNSTYEELSQYSLKNGEPIPLLEDFLIIKKKKRNQVKLIVEIKDCNVSDLISLINKYELQNEVEYISFSTRFCNQLVNLGYGNNTFFLGGGLEPNKIKELNYGGIDYNYPYYDSNENWIEEAKNLNLKTIVWTVNDMEKLKDFVKKEVIVTTDYPQKGYEIEKNIYWEQ